MTQEETVELLDTLMIAVNRLVDVKLGAVVKSEICIVRYVEDYNVYVRQSSNINTPTHATPASIAQLDDGDFRLPNISGHILVAGDGVEVAYTTNIEDGVVVRRLIYAPVVPGGGGSDVDPSDAMPQMDGTGPGGGGSAGVASTYARGDHIHPPNSNKLSVGAIMTNQDIENIMNS